MQPRLRKSSLFHIDGATIDVECDYADAGSGVKPYADYYCVAQDVYDLQAFQDAYGTDLDPIRFFDLNPHELRGIVEP